jgi:hypothetical protein
LFIFNIIIFFSKWEIWKIRNKVKKNQSRNGNQTIFTTWKNNFKNYLQTVKIDSSTYSPHLENGVPSFHVKVCEDSNIFKIVLPASDCNPCSVQEEPPDEEGASASSEDENQPVIRRSTRERRAPLRYVLNIIIK